MLSSVGYPLGSGAKLLTDQANSSAPHIQIMKPALSAPTAEDSVYSDGLGLKARATAPAFVVPVVSAGGRSLPVKLPGAIVDTSLRLGFGRTWHMTYGFIGPGSNIPLLTTPPDYGERTFIQAILLTIRTGGSGLVQISDSTISPSTIIYQGTPPPGVFLIEFPFPTPLSAIGTGAYVRLDTTGASINGDVVMWGFWR